MGAALLRHIARLLVLFLAGLQGFLPGFDTFGFARHNVFAMEGSSCLFVYERDIGRPTLLSGAPGPKMSWKTAPEHMVRTQQTAASTRSKMSTKKKADAEPEDDEVAGGEAGISRDRSAAAGRKQTNARKSPALKKNPTAATSNARPAAKCKVAATDADQTVSKKIKGGKKRSGAESVPDEEIADFQAVAGELKEQIERIEESIADLAGTVNQIAQRQPLRWEEVIAEVKADIGRLLEHFPDTGTPLPPEAPGSSELETDDEVRQHGERIYLMDKTGSRRSLYNMPDGTTRRGRRPSRYESPEDDDEPEDETDVGEGEHSEDAAEDGT